MTRAIAAAVLVLATAVGSSAKKPPRVGVATLTFTKTSVTTGQPRVLTTAVWFPAARKGGPVGVSGSRDVHIRPGRYPLVIFSHGTCGSPTEAQYLMEALAAQGFIVAAPPHPGNTATDFPGCLGGAQFADSALNRVPDVRFVLDAMLAEAANGASRFSGRIRTDQLAITGLSFGGFTTLLAAQVEPRFTAALAMVPGGIGALNVSIPTMVIGSENDEVVGFADSEKAYQRLSGPRFLIELLGGTHLSVTDECGVLCHPEAPSQATSHRLVLHYALPFFRRYVARKHVPAVALTRKIRGVQVTAETHRP